MHVFRLRASTAVIIGLICLIVIVGAFVVNYLLDRWTQQIVNTNTDLTRTTVHKIAEASEQVLDSLSHAGFFRKSELTRQESREMDTLLSKLVVPHVGPIIGMEGGFYLANVRELLGYAWPTSPPPLPAYGPAPRSYNIILGQAERTVREDRPIIELHQFDVATFPLALEPIRHGETTIGAVWARIHVERELPSSRIARWLSVTVGVSLLALFIVFLVTVRLRTRVGEIRRGLERLHTDSSYRLPVQKGIFGAISSSINTLVEVQLCEQERREQLERELHQQDKMATLGRLVAGVAHEVKTPLANIKTRVQMWQRRLRKSSVDPDPTAIISEESMNLIVDEIDRLSDLVKRLLVFAKPVTGRRQPVDVNVILQQVISALRPDADRRHISIRTDLDPALPLLKSDAQALGQVFLNVSTNALEAIQGSGEVRIITSNAADQNCILVRVEDSGPGIPADILDKIFEPFFTTKEQGAGLGLAISHEIVRAHEGTIEFQIGQNGGTSCRILLPLRQKGKTKE